MVFSSIFILTSFDEYLSKGLRPQPRVVEEDSGVVDFFLRFVTAGESCRLARGSPSFDFRLQIASLSRCGAWNVGRCL